VHKQNNIGKMSLYVFVKDLNLKEDMKTHLEKRRWTDSGFDLLSVETFLDFNNKTYGVELRLGVHCAALDAENKPVPYLLLARSSTSLTPLRMSNQIGLADAGYRGELIARVDCVSGAEEYIIQHGRRLFQIVQHNWLPWQKIILVDNLEDLPAAPDNRGSGGFGSTGS
jgi:dUTP pyrophosphatase